MDHLRGFRWLIALTALLAQPSPAAGFAPQAKTRIGYEGIKNSEHSYWVLRSRALNTAQKYVGSRCRFVYNPKTKDSFTAKRKSYANQRMRQQLKSRPGTRNQVWINLVMEAKDTERCPDSVYKWNCLVQFKYKSSGLRYDFSTEKAKCFKNQAHCNRTYNRRILGVSKKRPSKKKPDAKPNRYRGRYRAQPSKGQRRYSTRRRSKTKT